MVVARGGQDNAGMGIHVGSEVGVRFGDLSLVGPDLHGSALLEGQRVEGNVFGRQSGEPSDRVLPLRNSLVRKAIHEIEVDVIEARFPGCPEGFHRAVGCVATSQELQQTVVQALHANAETVHILLEETSTRLVVQVAGIGLDRYLRTRVYGKRCRSSIQDFGNASVRQIRRCSATEKYSAHTGPAQGISPQAQFTGYCIEKTHHLRFDALIGVEVAVRALGLAEGHMNIEANARRWGHDACIVR